MNKIKISKIKGDDKYRVEVLTQHGNTTHTVIIDKNYFGEILPAGFDEEALIQKSFEFLLEREPNTSILKEFDLKEISNYFPEYKEKMF